MKKQLITSLVLLISLIGFSQTQSLKGKIDKKITKVENMAITVTVDSAEELQSVFKPKDIKEFLEMSGKNENLSFQIICNKKDESTGVVSQVSYKIEGNSDESESFQKTVEKIRLAAIDYYEQN